MKTRTLPRLEGNWVAAAAGPGNVTITLEGGQGYWALTDDQNTAPDMTRGHRLSTHDDFNATLEAGEILWIKGSGNNVFITGPEPTVVM